MINPLDICYQKYKTNILNFPFIDRQSRASSRKVHFSLDVRTSKDGNLPAEKRYDERKPAKRMTRLKSMLIESHQSARGESKVLLSYISASYICVECY